MTKESKSKPKLRPLAEGEVLKTSPAPGFWGCVVVLKTKEKTSSDPARALLAVTDVIFTRDYTFEELDWSAVKVMHFNRIVRLGKDDYGSRPETQIQMYMRDAPADIPVIGKIDPTTLWSKRLQFRVGDESEGGWPMCGQVNSTLGFEAVNAWRAVHDKEQFDRENAEGERTGEELFARLAQEDTEKRARAKARKGKG